MNRKGNNMKITIKYKHWDCYVEFNKYAQNGNNAICLYEVGTDEPIAVATVNLPGVRLNPDEVIIKNYTENEGMLKTLVNAKIISEPISVVQHGFVNSPICKLLVNTDDN